MNKKVKVTSLATAALASMFLAGANLSNNVKADVVPAGTNAKAKSATDNAKDNVTSAQTEVDAAQSDVESAEGIYLKHKVMLKVLMLLTLSKMLKLMLLRKQLMKRLIS
ncbi:hypothetical protein [Lactobacillus kefiranofaciens]|uniref:Uncharacterized protein n=1 Tax=Lactobacillus kefiranofaciens TaxID=267818 RepID=A0AAX3UGI1_9LACO|nr:hypothetical protein [Lactobacillus kefiranofaciens]AEG39862.1 Hypothetical protein WANG_0167 [Lactobacillus kefiranofaciens subsp. kefiranofaciens]KRM20726.1 hypothetical protein FC93_GL001357 [Lactobacillus kefiranofaciens subsp. kefiranofaciens DSM 5016 = JCM 6985]QFQ67469.1 hypothetical protein LKK75_02920 [Lactobacillus kefiranofaciens subsp. kefiranofaciens]WGO86792.1 hypothetical protein QEJ78_04990 [Lactobacillus kefiranofaciens]WQH35891.1 hypothetical protein U2870_10450 [Lactobaci